VAKKSGKRKSKGAKKRKPIPIALSVNVCDQIIRDEVTKKVSLIGLFNIIHAYKFPAKHGLLHVYAALTNGHGAYQGQIQLVELSQDEVITAVGGPLQFQSPLQVIEINFAWPDMIIPNEGEYEFRILCDNDVVGTRKFLVNRLKDAPPLTSDKDTR